MGRTPELEVEPPQDVPEEEENKSLSDPRWTISVNNCVSGRFLQLSGGLLNRFIDVSRVFFQMYGEWRGVRNRSIMCEAQENDKCMRSSHKSKNVNIP